MLDAINEFGIRKSENKVVVYVISFKAKKYNEISPILLNKKSIILAYKIKNDGIE